MMKLTIDAQFACICGGIIMAHREGAILHSMPTCKAYDDLDPLEFVTWLRKAKGLPSPHPEDYATANEDLN